MKIQIVQGLDKVSDYLSTQISGFVKWYKSESGIKTINLAVFGLAIFSIASMYYVIYLFCRFVYLLAPNPEDGYKNLLAVCGIIAFVWASVRIIIVIGKLTQRFRTFKRERIDIPLRIWTDKTFDYLIQTKAAITYWEALKYFAHLSELITNKFFIWTLHSVLEPELESHNREEFFSFEDIPVELKIGFGREVEKRYDEFGFPLGLLWAMLLCFILIYFSSWVINPVNDLLMFVSGLFGEVFQSIVSSIFTVLLIVFAVPALVSFIVGVFIALNKRARLWRIPYLLPIVQEPQEQEYQELKEHLARKMSELIITTEKVNSINEQLNQRTQALAKLRQLEPELAGQIGVLVNMILEEEHTKSEISERKKEKKDSLKEIIIGAFFFILGLLITSDVIKTFYDKIVVFIKSLGT